MRSSKLPALRPTRCVRASSARLHKGSCKCHSHSPYGDIDDRVRAISLQMGLTPVIWTTSGGKTFDTQGATIRLL
jgi:hypothetical protein